MTDTTLYTKILKLSGPIKSELLDFMEFLIHKSKSKNVKRHPKAGCMRGIFKLNSDFDSPLEYFK
jgi:hypothetical protein